MIRQRLEGIFPRRLEKVFKTSWRRLEDVLKTPLQDVLKTFWRRLEDVLKTFTEDEWLRRIYSSWWRRLEDVFWRRRRKTSSEDERRLQVVFKTSSSRRMFGGWSRTCYSHVQILFSNFMWKKSFAPGNGGASLPSFLYPLLYVTNQI